MKLQWKFTVPNALSLVRVIAAPILVMLILVNRADIFKWIIAVAFLTDMLDGWIARNFHQESAIGSILDSWGDTLTILAGIAGVAFFKGYYFKPYMALITIALLLHIIQLLLSLWRYGKPSSFHSYTAKLSALFVGLFIVNTLFFDFSTWFFYATCFALILDACEETILIIMLPNWEHDVKGVWWVLRKRKEERRFTKE